MKLTFDPTATNAPALSKDLPLSDNFAKSAQ
jgi:hypothetical protein